MPPELPMTKVRTRILQSLKTNEGWMTRREIAHTLKPDNRGGMQKQHIDELENLVFFQYVERRDSTRGIAQIYYEYHYLKGLAE